MRRLLKLFSQQVILVVVKDQREKDNLANQVDIIFSESVLVFDPCKKPIYFHINLSLNNAKIRSISTQPAPHSTMVGIYEMRHPRAARIGCMMLEFSNNLAETTSRCHSPFSRL